MKKIFLISVFIEALSQMSCKKEDTNASIIPTPENPSVSFVNTHWNAHLSFTETVSGSPVEFEFELSMTFYSDSTGLIEQTTIKPFNDVAQFSFTYDFDGISTGNLYQTNMYGQQLHPMILLYEKEGETITLTRDDYSEDEHTKFDQVYHRVN